MNFFDYILLTIIGIPTILALWMGLVRIAVLLVGLVLAFVAASHLSPIAAELLLEWLPNRTAANIAGFALVFIIVMVIAGLIGTLINKLFDLANITWLDRVLGMFIGVASGLLVIAVGFLLIPASYTSKDNSWTKNSLLTPYAMQLSEVLAKAVPEENPFSRKGKIGKLFNEPDPISEEDKEALKSIIEKQMQ